MTLIAGFNLSDRIYIVGDTRITTTDETSVTTKDNVQKVIDINSNLAVAAAGNIRLARFLVKRFIKSELANLTISDVRLKIKDWIATNVDEYHKRYPYAYVCLLFAGRDSNKNKIISGKKLIKLTKEYGELTKTSQMHLKGVIHKGLIGKPNTPNPNPELPINNTILFSVISDYKNMKLIIEDTEWGDYLAYGPNGFSNKNVPKTILGSLEFEVGSENPFNNICTLVAFITSSKESYKLDTVGGTVVSMMVHGSDGLILITGNVHRVKLGEPKFIPERISNLELINNKLYYKSVGGIITPLIKFIDYPGGEVGDCVI